MRSSSCRVSLRWCPSSTESHSGASREQQQQGQKTLQNQSRKEQEEEGARGGFPSLPTEASFLQISAVSVLGLSAWLGPVAWDAAAASLALSSTHSPSEHSTSSKTPVGMWGAEERRSDWGQAPGKPLFSPPSFPPRRNRLKLGL